MMKYRFALFIYLVSWSVCYGLPKFPNSSPYGFIENKGQIIDQYNQPNPAVKYLWNGGGLKVQLKANSFSYEVCKHFEEKSTTERTYSNRVDVQFIDSNPFPKISAERRGKDYINYYTAGTPEQGITGVHYYAKVLYQDVYPNIDVEFTFNDSSYNEFKYNLIIRPGGDIRSIRMKYKGSDNTKLDADGCIVINTRFGKLQESIPQSYEKFTGKSIPVSYKHLGENVYGLQSTGYNTNDTLIVDPWVTYFGGFASDKGKDIEADNAGNIIITGDTYSSTNIASTGAYQDTLGYFPFSDIFIAKFSNSGERLWSTYYGGEEDDYGNSIDIDASDCIALTGLAYSFNNIASAGAFQANNIAVSSAFIARFNDSGFRQWATYYGSVFSEGKKIVTDSNRNLIVGGDTDAPDPTIVTPNAHQTTPGDLKEVFIAKFDSTGNRIWGTYYGGDGVDGLSDIGVDKNGDIFISGSTESSNNISTPGSFQPMYGGGFNGMLVKFNNAGIRQWGTYYPLALGDLAVDSGGNVWLLCMNNLIKFTSSNGMQVISNYCYGSNIKIDSSNNIFVAGMANSSLNINVNIATPNAYQTNIAGMDDAFLAKFDATGGIQWCTYLGGANDDRALSVEIDGNGCAFITGYTMSSTNIATSTSYQTIHGGDYDAFIASFSPSGSPLRIHLTTLAATNHGSRNIVQWRTASEDKGDYFELERSADGKSFEKLAMVAGTGYSSGSGYSYTDEHPFTGISYYRLKLYDASGSFQYSQVVTATLKTADAFALEVFPNPATKEEITVKTTHAAAGAAKLLITDVNGRVVKSLSLQQSTTVISIKGIPAGVYLLQYEDAEHKASVKLVRE